ncbi:type II toxin-antitoxin system HipA family toxin [Proteobacteria bacterium 005FR1]|nr:type II toxin-antitoxin system HipA family toxin [Proteobacteria bacterium 005FR1]
MNAVTTAEVILWGTRIGAVTWDRDRELGYFEYDPAFLDAPVEVSPIVMPKSPGVKSFPALPRTTFKGLPGLLADSLPDKFGNMLIDQWLADQGREATSFSPVERLCYIGRRGMGALEFRPAINGEAPESEAIDLEALVGLANRILTKREKLHTTLNPEDERGMEEGMRQIISVGSSAGGARAKAMIAWNPETGEVRSGQISAPDGFEYWLLKFDGVAENRDKERLADPLGYGRIEYAYYLMATAAGITMSPCRLEEENGRAHFMTKRFDRGEAGEKLHMQSLCAIAHYDFNQAGAYSYVQALQIIKHLRMPLERLALEEQFRRMVFNVMARNQDDHTKNIAFLMDRRGEWRLSPAFDVIFSYNPQGEWTARHQMSINGKRERFTIDDLLAVATHANLRPSRAKGIIDQVRDAILSWPHYAAEAGVDSQTMESIQRTHRSFR